MGKKILETYELSLDENSKITKIVTNSKHAIYSNGNEVSYDYNSDDGTVISNRENSKFKKYILIGENANIPDIFISIPEIDLKNFSLLLYSELINENESVESQEWYVIIKDQISFENVYKSLQIKTPKGNYYDLFNSDRIKYKYHDCSNEYPFALSIEKSINGEYKLEWYMSQDEEYAKSKIKEFKLNKGK